jgi:hypothetical protein
MMPPLDGQKRHERRQAEESAGTGLNVEPVENAPVKPADQAPVLPPLSAARPAVQSSAKTGKPKPPEKVAPTIPPSPESAATRAAEDLRRRKKTEAERRLKLEALAGMLKDPTSLAVQLQQKTGLPARNAGVITRLVRALLDDPDRGRAEQFQTWLTGKNTAVPDWLDASLEYHQAEFDQELAALTEARDESTRRDADRESPGH